MTEDKSNETKKLSLTVNNTKIDKNKIYQYILLFFFFAVSGWILETIYGFIVLGHFTKRGFLYGPLCPIYGFGGLSLVIFFQNYKGSISKLFIHTAALFTFGEYIIGFALDALFKIRLWDYTNELLNLNGRVSIFYTLVWGLLGIIFVKTIIPSILKLEKKVAKKIPIIFQGILSVLLSGTFTVDTILSCIKYLKV